LQRSFTGSKPLDGASQTVSFLGAAGSRQEYYCRKCEKSISTQDVSRRLVALHVRKYLPNIAQPTTSAIHRRGMRPT